MLSHWRHHHSHLPALQSNRNSYHHPGNKDNDLGLELGCACLCLLSGLFIETPAEGGFALRRRLERGAANVQAPWAVLLVLLLQRSSPWGKVGSEELQWWIWQLFACPMWEALPPLSCLHCSLFLQGSMDALQRLTVLLLYCLLSFLLQSSIALPWLPFPKCFNKWAHRKARARMRD